VVFLSANVTYTITEEVPEGWTLTDIDCGYCPDCTRDGNSIHIYIDSYDISWLINGSASFPSSDNVSFPDPSTASFPFSYNGTFPFDENGPFPPFPPIYECHFINTKNTGTINIIKEVEGTYLRDTWQFTGDLEFTIPPEGGSKTFSNLEPGTYSISETPVPGYRTEISCTNCTNCKTANGSVTIDIDRGDLVTCTFTNTFDPTLVSRKAGGIDQSTGVADPSSTTNIRTGDLRVSMLRVPGQTVANQPMTITANVVNDGNQTGSKRVALKINGRVEQTKLITVGGSSSRPVKFTVKKSEPGTYTVTMGSQRASFMVTEDTSQGGTDGSTIAIIILAVVFGAVILVLLLSYGRRPSY
jgi:hypothetical protein